METPAQVKAGLNSQAKRKADNSKQTVTFNSLNAAFFALKAKQSHH